MVSEIEIIKTAEQFVKQTLEGAESGHDWWHIWRVWNLAKRIAQNENCNRLVVELAALLHDIADSKFHDGNEEIGPQMAEKFLLDQKIDIETIRHIINIIRNISFKGGHKSDFYTIEFGIVQDADRLDALGAIGVARAFNYGGFKNRPMYLPDVRPEINLSREAYKNSVSPTLNHFEEKLFKLKNLMNTPLGKELAESRHHFLVAFYNEFLWEWNTEK